MVKTLKIFAAATGICLTTGSLAQDIQSTTLENFTCKDWMAKDAEKSYVTAGFVLGYLTGVNAAWDGFNRLPSNPLSVITSNRQVFMWFDAYCKTNPQKSILDGSSKLFFELVDRKKLGK